MVASKTSEWRVGSQLKHGRSEVERPDCRTPKTELANAHPSKDIVG